MHTHEHEYTVVRTFRRPGEDMTLVGECGTCGTTTVVGAPAEQMAGAAR